MKVNPSILVSTIITHIIHYYNSHQVKYGLHSELPEGMAEQTKCHWKCKRQHITTNCWMKTTYSSRGSSEHSSHSHALMVFVTVS